VGSSQTLGEADRRLVAAWAADGAERVLGVFEAETPGDDRPRAATARARTHASGELSTAEGIRSRFTGGVRWQLAHMSPEIRAALSALPPVGDDRSGPLGPGLLASGQLGAIIRQLQAAVSPDPGCRPRRQPDSASRAGVLRLYPDRERRHIV
jgi:hypothetical protein